MKSRRIFRDYLLLLIVLAISTFSIFAANEVSVSGNLDAELYFKLETRADFGFSSTPVSKAQPEPTPISGDIVLSDDDGLADDHLIGRGQCYVYWDLFSNAPMQAKIKLDSGPMQLSTDETKKLDWGVLVTREDGVKEYLGAQGLSANFEDGGQFQSREDYNSEVDLFDPDDSHSSLNHSFYRFGSASLEFVTADAVDSTQYPRGNYEGYIRVQVQFGK